MNDILHTNLFDHLLGAQSDVLPVEIAELHRFPRPIRLHGQVRITPAPRALTRLLARIVGLPTRACEVPFHIDFESDAKHRDAFGEIWTRAFPPRPFRSRLRAHAGHLIEQAGPARLQFLLRGDEKGITWTLRGVHLFGIPLPLRFFADIHAREFVVESRYHFEVAARLPLLGHFVAYRGWLLLPEVD